MRILLTGATGFIGSALIPLLLRAGHQITALTRSPNTAQTRFPAVKFISSLKDYTNLDEFDAVINLAGEPIFDHRWTAKQKARLIHSRVDLTQKLTALINNGQRPPHTFISGSATGYYADQGSQSITEHSPAGVSFAAELCRQWEQATQQANCRVCILRTAMVFDPSGGALKRILPLYRRGLGGKLGSGKQYWAWISLTDMLNAILFLLTSPQCSGAFNLCAPNPITNADFNRLLGTALNRAHFMHAPAFLLHILLGERARLLTDSQKILPLRLQQAGFCFRHSTFSDLLPLLLKS
ncbi:TIGR01777 family oxidoreductase [Caviibacterium pharyngocola]|uniref:TIGR01777 family protein n=1 Tax=Caviibacterium pharyngocola TaxID=28159 RepID=A0A2M8RWW5_9PAST|nr:TIGR01777 family oxidoreductase [Caviibacterium pharyngocola]PJG83385.1 TIGR01777 family protein [Caviibacterium pharyngocola]